MDPTLINAPTAPKVITCPGDYTKYKSACFRFGSHSSYEMAKSSCENNGARLISIDSKFAKYIRDQVRTMGGNDFWIGSFVNRGRVYRQKGRTSCPIMRGQMINDALYGLVDCNSANRYICQKYGPKEEELDNPFDRDPSMGGRPSLPPTTVTTTEKVEAEEDGGLSPVIYVVITVIILIIALVALKIIIGRYFRDKKKAKPAQATTDTKKDNEPTGKGQVFSPKWRKDVESKTTSLDSAVPPSNVSTTLEKPKADDLTAAHAEDDVFLMGRPRVNGPEPTKQPSDVEDDVRYRTRHKEKNAHNRASNQRRHRRTHSDPRSEYSEYDFHRRPGRRRSYFSDYSRSPSESESDDSSYSGQRYGPKKVFQRQASRNGIRREHLHYNMDPSYYGPPRRDKRRHHEGRHHGDSRHYGRSHNSHLYRNDDHGDYGRYRSHREEQNGHYGRRERTYGRKKSHVPTLSARVQNHTVERQYFPDPHRLMSWNNMGEIGETTLSEERLVKNSTRSFPREPIRVNRQIYHPMQKVISRQNPAGFSIGQDDSHLYESLDESKRNKQLKKASERSKNKKRREKRGLERASLSRASGRSVASIQSRRLPTPPS